MRNNPSSTSRVNFEACQTYATSRLGTKANSSDQSARVSPEIVVSVCPFVRFFKIARRGRPAAVQPGSISPL